MYRRILGIKTIFAHLWRDVAATVVRSTRERTSIIYWWPMSCSPASCSCCTIWRTTSASSKRCGRRSPATVCGTLKIEFSVAESEMCNSSDWRTWDEKRTATSSWFQSTRVRANIKPESHARALGVPLTHVKCNDLGNSAVFPWLISDGERMDLDLLFVLLNE